MHVVVCTKPGLSAWYISSKWLTRKRPLRSLLHVRIQGVEALLKGIGPTSAIQRLDLENKGMSPGIAASLSNAITKSRSLKSVLLARNALKDSGKALLSFLSIYR